MCVHVGVGACGCGGGGTCVSACLSYYTGNHQNLFVIFLMYDYVSLSAND